MDVIALQDQVTLLNPMTTNLEEVTDSLQQIAEKTAEDVTEFSTASASTNVQEDTMHNTLAFKPGDWALATYTNKSGPKLFLGLILQTDDGEALIKFCRSRGNYFIWPTADDTEWVDVYCLTHVQTPSLDAREKMRMSLTDDEMERYFSFL